MLVIAFDIGYHHFAWAKVHRSSLESRKPRSSIQCMDCHDFHTDKLSELYPMLLEYLSTVDVHDVDTVLIEQQMNRMNIKATKISVFVLSYFMIRHPHIRVMEYPAYHKTTYFGRKGLTKPQRKQFSIDYVVTHIAMDDPVFLDWLEQFPKKDDICDCIMMAESYFQKSEENHPSRS